MLKFSKENAKTSALTKVPELQGYLANGRKVYSFDLLAGYSCPFAKECKSQVVERNGRRKIQDGPNTVFRCFSASQEVLFTNTYNLHRHNFNMLRKQHLNDMIAMIHRSLPPNLGVLRLHVSGDFFNSDYFFAWLNIAMMHTDKLFYAYTKSVRYWEQYREYVDNIDNLVLTASYGGWDDYLIRKCGFRSALVVFNEEKAKELGLPLDHDDSHAACPSMRNVDFALLIHGTQPKGSEAAKAKAALKGKGSYRRKGVAV